MSNMFELTQTDFIYYSFFCLFMLIGYAAYMPHIIAILFTRSYLYHQTTTTTTSSSSSSSQQLQQQLTTTTTTTTSASSSNHHSSLGVSILKPLVGVDANLRQNLLSFFTMDYPLYELLFCVANATDPACDLVQQLMYLHPNVNARLLTSADNCGINHKVNNMNQGYKVASYDIILISDSGIFMRPDTLTDMMNVLTSQDRVSMVHQVPYIKPPTCNAFNNGLDNNNNNHQYGFSLRYQQVYFGSWHARNYMTAGAIGISCTTGMSTLIRKPILDDAGGLENFASYLAEDYFMAKFMTDRGYRVLLAHQPAWQNPAPGSLPMFHERLKRWYQMRLMMVPTTAIFEPLSDCFLVNGFITCLWNILFFNNGFDFIYCCAIFIIHCGVWFLLDYVLFCHIHPPDEPSCMNLWQYAVAWFYRECCSLSIQLRGSFSRYVVWRNKVYRLHFGGRADDVTDEVKTRLSSA